jgi:hypothetical protein
VGGAKRSGRSEATTERCWLVGWLKQSEERSSGAPRVDAVPPPSLSPAFFAVGLFVCIENATARPFSPNPNRIVGSPKGNSREDLRFAPTKDGATMDWVKRVVEGVGMVRGLEFGTEVQVVLT